MKPAIGVVLTLAALTQPAVARERRPLAAGLQGNPGQFFGPDAYPPEAQRAREQGRVVARLTVGIDGRVTDCKVAESSGSTALDVRTCVIAVGRVRFRPARDDRGKPIESSYVLPVRWVLPQPVAMPRRSLDERFTLILGADDRVLGCKAPSATRKTDAAALCAEWRSAAMIRGLRDRAGPGRVTLTLQQTVFFPGTAPAMEAHRAVGQTVLGLRRVAVDVLPDGSLANEQVVEQVGTQDGAAQAFADGERYEPAGATVQVLILNAASFAIAR